MKRFLTIALVASLGLFVAGSASAGTFEQVPDGSQYSPGDYAEGMSANGIGTSRHNLGAFGEHIVTSSTTEICIFCHTPHHSNTAAKPLWNRGMTSTFTAYGSTIGSGYVIVDSDVGPATLACLTCHDGQTTFDNIVNAPGKSGTVMGGSSRGWDFTEVAEPVMTSARLNIGGGAGGGQVYGAGSGGTDDHPVGIMYHGGEHASLRSDTTVIADINLTADLIYSSLHQAEWDNISQNLWAVGGFISAEASIQDLLRPNKPGMMGGKVECSSCHDPHFNNKSWSEVITTWQPSGGTVEDAYFESNGLFLRRVGGNTGSGVCRTCHEK